MQCCFQLMHGEIVTTLALTKLLCSSSLFQVQVALIIGLTSLKLTYAGCNIQWRLNSDHLSCFMSADNQKKNCLFLTEAAANVRRCFAITDAGQFIFCKQDHSTILRPQKLKRMCSTTRQRGYCGAYSWFMAWLETLISALQQGSEYKVNEFLGDWLDCVDWQFVMFQLATFECTSLELW